MTRLFRSKSCGLAGGGVAELSPAAPAAPIQDSSNKENSEEEELESDDNGGSSNYHVWKRGNQTRHSQQQQNQFAILDVVVGVLKRSLVTCSVEMEREREREREEDSSLDISWPTNVRHVSHVTFDRFNGFLGLPSEFQPEVPARVPSASVKVFGVSAKSMQCSYDDRGNSVPTILLTMQKQLYSEGGLKAEGIFRINAENSQEEFVRDQLNRGVVPHGIDVHCLSGLMKAWFRELPTGVLDSLTPEQVMHCNTEEDCTNLVKLLPSTEAALLDWAINLMADVVENENFNKMNARNVAMVFAPNMTQMVDPLTALIHAVQVMNFLKTLILKTIREREKPIANAKLLSPPMYSPSYNNNNSPPVKYNREESCEQMKDACDTQEPAMKRKFSRTSTLGRIECCVEKLWSSEEKGNEEEGVLKSVSGGSVTSRHENETSPLENSYRSRYYDSEHWLRLRKGVRKICRHPVFQLSKPSKKPPSLGIVNTREGGGEAWA